MKKDINLAAKTQVQKKVLGRLVIISIGLFSVFFAISAILLFYSLILKGRASGLEEEVASTRSKISSYSKQKETLLVISERLTSIQKVLSSRKNIDARVGTIVSFIPDRFNIDSMRADEEVVTIALMSPSLRDYESFLETEVSAISKDKDLGVKSIEVGGFSQRTGGYILSLNFYFINKTQ
jgi:hypothetical protein